MPRRPIEPVVVASVGAVPPGQTRKFTLTFGDREEEAFVLNHGGRLCAYLNRCRHVPMTLDWVENQFLTEDGRFILCATHGAIFEPGTGECVDGPPRGKRLLRVELAVDGDQVLAVAVDGDEA